MNDGIEAGEMHDNSEAEAIESAIASATPRRMKQPIKDELRRRLEVATAQGVVLQAQLDDALPMSTVHKLLVVAVLLGVALGRFVL